MTAGDLGLVARICFGQVDGRDCYLGRACKFGVTLLWAS